MTLRSDVEHFIAHGSNLQSLFILLDACAADGTAEGLAAATRLFEDMYGGITHNFELKAPSAWELACWGEPGLDQLVAATIKQPTSKNVSLCVVVLGALSSGQTAKDLLATFCDESRKARLEAKFKDTPSLQAYARSKLIEFVLSFDDDQSLLDMVGIGFNRMSMLSGGPAAARELFEALSARWLTISKVILERYQRLIVDSGDDEPSFQAFFTEHPQLLDPMAAQVWPHPDLHGSRVPDFVIRRFDNSYVVIEIETPAKQLVTEGNQLSALATHAMAQVSDYRRFLERLPNVQAHFPELDQVTGLAVIGLESPLRESQRQALRNDNSQRHALQLVGFDWLINRAQAIRQNIIRKGIEVVRARVV